MAQTWRIVVGMACACVCNGARADVVKLAELEMRALARKPEAEASAARIRQANAGVGAAQTGYRPTISASLDASLAPGRTLVSITDDDGNRYLVSGTRSLDQSTSAFSPSPRYGGSVSARGNFYDFGRTRAALDAARAKQRASQADARARAEVLVLEVRAAYLRWSVAYALYDLAKQAEAGALARVERVNGLIAEGASPPSAATSANAATNLAASEAERAALELETARHELGYLSARDLGADAVPEPGLLAGSAAPVAANPQPSAAAASGGSNARLEALETARAAADAESEAQSRLSAPAIGYRLNAGIEGQNEKLFPVYAVGVGLTVPLWDGGATSAAEAGARAVAAELAAQLDAERARDTHLRARQTMQAPHVERLISLAEAAVTLAETRIAQLQAGPTLASAEQAALADAEAERSRARADLIRARATRAQLALGLP